MKFKFQTTITIPVIVEVTNYHPAIYDKDDTEYSVNIPDNRGRGDTKFIFPRGIDRIIEEDIENEIKQHGDRETSIDDERAAYDRAETRRERIEEMFRELYP